jgi:hypothetical protein
MLSLRYAVMAPIPDKHGDHVEPFHVYLVALTITSATALLPLLVNRSIQ